MYIPDFESFYEQAAALYRSNPLQTRYCVKYHRDGALQLKVTDDHKVGQQPAPRERATMRPSMRARPRAAAARPRSQCLCTRMCSWRPRMH